MYKLEVNYTEAIYSDTFFLAQKGFAWINSHLCDTVSLIIQIPRIKDSNQMDSNKSDNQLFDWIHMKCQQQKSKMSEKFLIYENDEICKILISIHLSIII